MKIAVVVGFVSSLFASVALAQQTQTYTYDVHGRLMTVSRDSGSNVQVTSYGIDNADNRASRVVTSPATARANNAHTLDAGTPAPETRSQSGADRVDEGSGTDHNKSNQ